MIGEVIGHDLVAVVRRCHHVALIFQDGGKREADVGIVFHDQNFLCRLVHGAASAGTSERMSEGWISWRASDSRRASGRVHRKILPAPLWLSSHRRPPCRSMSVRAM